MKSALRLYQSRALDLLRQVIREGARRPLLQLPTGAGKSLIAAKIVAGAPSKGRRVAVVAPTSEIVRQLAVRLEAEALGPAGVMRGGRPANPAAPVQVISAQTLAHRAPPPVDVAVVDEAHVRHSAVERWLNDRPAMLAVGLSATPWTAGLGLVWDRLIVGATVAELTRAGLLAPVRVFAPERLPDLSKVGTRAGDFETAHLRRPSTGRC